MASLVIRAYAPRALENFIAVSTVFKYLLRLCHYAINRVQVFEFLFLILFKACTFKCLIKVSIDHVPGP